MTAAEVIAQLRERGYKLTVEHGRLKVRGPERPPEELERAIASNKAEILDLLVSREKLAANAKCVHGFKGPQKCASCNGYAAWLTSDEKRLEVAVTDPERSRAHYERLLRREPKFEPDWPDFQTRYDQKVVEAVAPVEETLGDRQR